MNDFILVTAVSEMDDGLGRVVSFRKMLDQVVKYDLEILVSYKGENLEKWRLDYPQKNIFFNLQKSTSGIGAAVVEVFGMACVKFDKKYIIWIEPQKVDMPRCIANNLHKIQISNESLLLFSRITYVNYPFFQMLHYRILRGCFNLFYRHEVDIDVAFGPFGIRKDKVDFFFNNEYRKWSRYILPRVGFIVKNDFRNIDIDFVNDLNMYNAEKFRINFIIKRFKQFFWLFRDLFITVN